MTDSERFEIEMLDTPTLASMAQKLKTKAEELQRQRLGYGNAHEDFDKWTKSRWDAMQKRKLILKVLKSRQLTMF